MMPDLQTSLICDDIRQERNGKFILIGIFDSITVPQLPAVYQRLCIFNRWCCGAGEFEQRSRIVSPEDNTLLIGAKPVKVKLKNDENTATCIEFFMNTRFSVTGRYWVEILLDGNLKLRYPLLVNCSPQKFKT